MKLGLTPDTRWRTDDATLAGAAAAAGFEAVGMSSLLVTPQSSAVLASNHLVCHELLGLVVTDSETTTGWAERIVEQIPKAGALWVNTTFKEVDAETPALAKRCADMFAEVGAGMAIEFSPLGPVANLADGCELANEIGASLVVDVWNAAYSDTTFSDIEGLAPEQIAYVQFDDALQREGDLEDEALNRRTYPGLGVFELEKFVHSVRVTGWDGIVSVQILSAELREVPLDEFTRRAYETSASYWS
jgi:sugar phosphate isomerase/epimerase